MSAFAIETHNLNYSFSHNRKVVNDLSLQVPEASIYGFLGPNGAGKTTTIKLLAGMLLSEKDNINIQGKSLIKSIPEIYTSIGTLIEMPSLYLHLTAKENLRIIATLRRIEGKRIDEVLEIVGLTAVAKRKVGQFSLGMKQRLGIAMALMPDPQLLILDEPANGLDPTGIIEIRNLIKQLNKDHGKTIFVSSHLLAEVEKTCSHIGIIHHGELKYQGTLQELKTAAHSTGEVVFTIPDAEHHLPQIENVYTDFKQLSQNELIFSFTTQADVPVINQKLVSLGIPVQGIQVKGGLEEWFMNITQTNKQIA